MAKNQINKKAIGGNKPLALPPILEKTLRFNALKYEDNGLFLLWGTPCIIDPIQMKLYEDFLLKKELGFQKAAATIYNIAKLQAFMGVNIICKRYGYAETINEKLNLLNFNIGQFELLGQGKFTKEIVDFKNNIFIYTSNSQYAKEHSSFLGLQKQPVDHFVAGLWAGCIEAIIGTPMVCIETKCIATGSNICEFVIKAASAWDKKLSSVKNNKLLFDQKYIKDIKKDWKVFYVR